MVWRTDDAPQRGFQDNAVRAGGSPVLVKLMLMAVTFLLVVVGLILLQPRPEPDALADDAAPIDHAAPIVEGVAASAPMPTPAPLPVADPEPAQMPVPVVEEPEVTRAAASLLELQREYASEEASDLLRRPEYGARDTDLSRLTSDVLAAYGHDVAPGDRLHTLLVQALANRKSDAYIDALLNTAAARGEFIPPEPLRLPSGRLDTPRLLGSLVARAHG